MSLPDAIVFDLDGTLIHSVPDMHVSLNRTLKAFGRTPLDLKTITGFVGNGVEKLVQRSLAATGGDPDAKQGRFVAAFLADYATQKTVLTRPYPGVLTCLRHLQSAGVPMAVCTNKPQEPAIEMCSTLGLAPYFGAIHGARAKVPKKPDPAPLWATIDALGAARENTVFVGDSAVDYETARNAKIAFRLYSGGYLNAPLPDLNAADRFDDWNKVQFSTLR